MGLLSTIGAASGRAFGFTRSAIAVATDAFFNRVTLLLPGNGTNGAQNNTFLDSSSNNFTITRNGNTTQGTFSPFSQAGWSVNLDGTGDYLTVADNAVLDMGSSNFTMEFWTYITGSLGTYQALVSKRASTGTYGGISLYVTSSRTLNLQATLNGSTWGVDVTTTSTVNLNEWAHIAVVRNGNVWTVYINGTSGATTTVSGTVPDNSSAFTIGAGAADGGHNMVAAYISNFRLVKGTALYTANFTPSTSALTTTSQGATATEVELLTCQGNRFVDISDNAFAITVNGNPSVQAFSPFAPTAAYSAATVGGSGYFDGSGDYLTVADTTNLRPPNGDFTYEIWWYPTSLSGIQGIFTKGNGVQIYLASGVMNCSLSSNNSTTYFVNSGFGAPILNAWNHIAVVRSGNDYYGYLNGTRTLLGTSTSFPGTGTDAVGIGAYNSGVYLSFGYLSGARYTTGALYTASPATSPTAPPTTTVSAGTCQLLLNYTNAGITDATAKNVLETVGNAQISTTQSKFGGSSMYFDGTGDYLIPNVATSDLYAFGSGDFTIEMWVNFPVVGSSGVYTLYDSRPSGTQGAYASIALDRSTAKIYYYVSSATRITGSVTIAANTWYHVAISRSGTSTRLFVNGTQDGSTWTDSTTYLNPANRPVIAASGSSLGTEATNGYIDDLRITKGYARYTSNFTAPTAAFPLL